MEGTPPREGDDVLPLAPSQEALWEFLKYFSPRDPGGAPFNVSDYRQLDGVMHLESLCRAVSDVARRHDFLRIAFTDLTCDPGVRITSGTEPDISFVDLSGRPDRARTERLRDLVAAGWQRGYDVLRAPLWSVCVVRLSSCRHVVIVSLCHLVADGWSLGVFFDDLMTAYAARCDDGPVPEPVGITFQDVAEAQRRAQSAAPGEDPLPHSGPVSPALLFPVRARPGDEPTAEARCPFSFGPELTLKVRALARELRTTPFVLLFSAYQICLRQRTGLDGLRFGTVTLGRRARGYARLVGQFTTNVYVMSAAHPRTSLREAVGETHRRLERATSREWSFRRVAREVHPGFVAERPWPFLHLFHSWFQAGPPASARTTRTGGLTVSRPPSLDEQPREPATVLPTAVPGALELWAKRGAPSITLNNRREGGDVTYDPRFFDGGMVVHFAADYVHVVRSVVDEPDGLVGRVTLSP